MNDDLTYSPPKPGKMPMFGSLHVELPVESLMQSKHIYQGSIAIDTENYRADSIKLEYLANNRMGKRSSFLLTNFDEDSILPMKKLSSFTYEGATISKVDDPNNQPKTSVKTFCTGSKYIGEYNRLGMAGKDNPERRLLIDYTEVPKPKLVVETLDEEKSITYDLLMQNSPSQELLLNSLRWNLIPRPQKIDSVPAQEIEQWIKYNCRKSWDESTGYRGDLYEVWTAGYREESLACTDQLKAMNSLDESNEIAKTSLLENVDLLPSDPAVPNNNPTDTHYCKMPDRRYQIEMENGIMPAGQEYLTNATVPREIPEGMYDTGGGFYEPERRLLIDYTEVPKPKLVVETLDEEKSIIYDLLMQNSPSQELLLNSLRWNLIPRPQKIDSVPAQEIEQWIKHNCRKSWDESTGYRGDLYEVWTAGKCYREEGLACTDQLKAMNSLDESNEIAKTSLLENVDLLPSDPAVPSRNKYSKMYSFILHHTQNIEKYIHDGRKCSYLNLSHMFVPVSSPHDLPKRKEIHLQRRSKNPKSRASSAPGSPKLKSGTYGLKYLLKHHQIQKKKSGVRVENDLIDE
ncbi:hypothetical protein HUJ04_011076 [Dendroctonus ponderosae]|nr:hypothetical protein HUJ04_011076 [Dendroctonus ponderosae]